MADPTVTPDLASILATLAQFAPQQQEQQTSAPPPAATTPTITDPRLQRRLEAQTSQSTSQPYNQIPQHLQQTNVQSPTPYNPQAAVFQPVIPQQRAIPQPSRTSTPQQQEQTIIDPATITEWTAGLRCVTKIAAQNPLFAEKIRGLINDQRRNEMQWYSGRQALKQVQAKRCTSSNELQNIFQKIGSKPTPSIPQTPEEKAAELAAYDQKLYKAQCTMNESMSQVLKHLGVPFFGTHAALILPDDKTKATGQDGKEGGQDKVVDVQGERPKWSPRVTAKELMELKRRMVEYLEDMYKA
ncbi:hypothetical protein M436DRAFT_41266 [Aureobasidium namibiae CBS 147.97]|uniref:Uncharacterized protein n=1 Tax=Aureobasidium namibiae CBS 147.97 TaxID=1043004 RepID=A0A074WVW6_9PEZI